MSKNAPSISGELHRQIQDVCRRIAGAAQITAMLLLDNNSASKATAKSTVEVVAVIHDFQPRLRSYVTASDGKNVIVVAVDQWVFDRDVDRGFLGEALAGTLLVQYYILDGEDYLQEREILLKKRLILELLANLVLSFPELSYFIRVKPQYFMYETVLNRVRIFPPLAYGIPSFMYGNGCTKDTETVLDGYMEALAQLEKAKKIRVSDGYVMLPKRFVEENKKPIARITNLLSKQAPRTVFNLLFGFFPQLLNFFSQNTDFLLKFQKLAPTKSFIAARHLVDPQKYVFVPTAEGLVSLADRIDIGAFAQKMLRNCEKARITFERIGGVLNDVYLIKAKSKDAEKKILVKRFKEWSGFKWLPLTLWSLGARSFSVLGSSRLERECAISERLRRAGFNVPKILSVSHNERLVFMEYIEGENLSNAIKRIALAKGRAKTEPDFAKIAHAGATLAQVHAHNIALGDTKPENVIISPDGAIFLLDFEQAAHGGDKAWDVAEFLYYAGHYLPPLSGNSKAEAIARAFIRGYLNANGDVNNIRKAGASKYTRVFSVFTLPAVILAMSNVCKKTKH